MFMPRWAPPPAGRLDRVPPTSIRLRRRRACRAWAPRRPSPRRCLRGGQPRGLRTRPRALHDRAPRPASPPRRSFATLLNNSRIDDAQRAALLAGAPVDARNRSTADVYFSVSPVPESPGLWMYT